jgi:hemin uptake protein HemP
MKHLRTDGEGSSSRPDRELPTDPQSPLQKTFRSDDLFGGARFLVIEHAGEQYRLQITRQGKLILTK